MGSYAALNHTTYLAGYDLTGDSNKTQLDIAYDELDDSRFGMTGRSRIAGLENVESMVEGIWDAGSGTVDPELITGLGSTVQVVTQTPTGTEGDTAWFYQSKKFKYQIFGDVGAVLPFQLAMKGTKGSGTASVGAVRGKLAKAKGSVSATGALGTGYQLGAVSATQYLYGALHVFSAGTTITVVLESDDNSGFTSATTRATLGPITAVGGTWATRVAGAITDDYFRYRVTAITGTFSVAGAIGIK